MGGTQREARGGAGGKHQHNPLLHCEPCYAASAHLRIVCHICFPLPLPLLACPTPLVLSPSPLPSSFLPSFSPLPPSLLLSPSFIFLSFSFLLVLLFSSALLPGLHSRLLPRPPTSSLHMATSQSQWSQLACQEHNCTTMAATHLPTLNMCHNHRQLFLKVQKACGSLVPSS